MWKSNTLKQHHVVHNPNGGWDVKAANSQRVSVHTNTKAEAIAAGRTISQNQKTELFIHNMNGQFASCDSHGNDPFPPRSLTSRTAP